jgi:ribulose-phosphate 3-epimerase
MGSIQICPAILTSSEDEFKRELEVYSKLFEVIDIDINLEGDKFYGQVTVGTDFVAKEIQKFDVKFNIHLMVSNPLREIEKFSKEQIMAKNISFFIHQESNINKLIDRVEELNLKLAVKAGSEPREIEFYKKFPEIQLMTIETGKQGNKFKPEILSRAEWLRTNGYEGNISIDGSVNLESARIIRQHKIDRVSAGSYFSRSENVSDSKMKLALALNL